MIENNIIGTIILNYNSYDMTCKLVKKASEMSTIDYIVLIDNNSKDDFTNFMNDMPDKVIYHKAKENKGYASGNNIGFRILSEKNCDISFVINPDITFDEECIIKMSEFLINNDDYAVVSCSRSKVGEKATGQYWWIPDYKYTLLESTYIGRRYLDKKCIKLTNRDDIKYSENDFIPVEVVGGAFWGSKLDILENIGYLDEKTFLWYEENILSFILREKGYKVGFLKNCHYIHNHVSKGHGNPNFKIFLDSKRHYCYNYLKIGMGKKLLLKLFDNIGYMEEKIICKIFKN